MDEKTIAPGYEVPVLDEEKNDNYAAVEAAVNEHNETAQPGETYWGISLENEKYTVYEYGEVPTPPTEEEQIETLRAKKLEEASDACEAAITAGITARDSASAASTGPQWPAPSSAVSADQRASSTMPSASTP